MGVDVPAVGVRESEGLVACRGERERECEKTGVAIDYLLPTAVTSKGKNIAIVVPSVLSDTRLIKTVIVDQNRKDGKAVDLTGNRWERRAETVVIHDNPVYERGMEEPEIRSENSACRRWPTRGRNARVDEQTPVPAHIQKQKESQKVPR